MVQQLAGAVAHKLKQPLAVAWGYLELILDESGALDPTIMRYLREIHLAVQSMDDVINRLQYATAYHTRQYPGGLEILEFDDLQPAG